MPKAASEKSSKSEGKTKRPASAYALFVKDQMPIWKEKNPGRKHTEAMKEIAGLWKDHPSNPNKGKDASEKKAAEKKKPGRPKKAAKKSEDEGDEDGGDDEE